MPWKRLLIQIDFLNCLFDRNQRPEKKKADRPLNRFWRERVGRTNVIAAKTMLRVIVSYPWVETHGYYIGHPSGVVQMIYQNKLRMIVLTDYI